MNASGSNEYEVASEDMNVGTLRHPHQEHRGMAMMFRGAEARGVFVDILFLAQVHCGSDWLRAGTMNAAGSNEYEVASDDMNVGGRRHPHQEHRGMAMLLGGADARDACRHLVPS